MLDLLKLSFAVVADIGGVIALVVAHRKQKVTEAAENRQSHLAMTGRHVIEQFAEDVVAGDPVLRTRLVEFMERQIAWTGREAIEDLARQIT
ncbi:hypothetical protein [Streptosporangium sp. NPDC002721]|uniref:hypothetical protein n=1 Tax=Streptosporangium sp. NPDC002721 TaxID=3366188 RepID=UPI003678462F